LTIIGDVFKSILTGEAYKVKLIKGISVVLESDDRMSQILTETENLDLFYEKIENKISPIGTLLITCSQNKKEL
jgi:hypothetical protein